MFKPEGLTEEQDVARTELTPRQMGIVRAALVGGETLIVDEKIDGGRFFLFKAGGKVLLATPHNGVYGPTGEFPKVRAAASGLPENTILDGEGLPENDKFYAYDVLTWAGQDTTRKSFLERRALMNQPIDAPTAARPFTWDEHLTLLPFKVITSAEEANEEFRRIVSRGGEGIMVKFDRPYRSPGSWLKVKAWDTEDCFVSGTHMKIKERVFELSAYHQDGTQVSLCDAYSAVASVDRVKESIQVGTVLEVRFQVTKGFERMRHPTILRIRHDKTPKECVISDERFAQIFPAKVAPRGMNKIRFFVGLLLLLLLGAPFYYVGSWTVGIAIIPLAQLDLLMVAEAVLGVVLEFIIFAIMAIVFLSMWD